MSHLTIERERQRSRPATTSVARRIAVGCLFRAIERERPVSGPATTSVARRIAVGCLFAVVLLVGVAAPQWITGYRTGAEGQDFLTAPVERGSIVTVVKATGAVNPVLTVDVGSQLSGRIADVFVNFNDPVVAGQVVARLDTELFVARVSEARAALKVAAAGVKLQQASLERAGAQVANAHAARGMGQAQMAALRTKSGEAERQLQRKIQLSQSGTVSQSALDKTQAERDIDQADVRAGLEQMNMRGEAIQIAESELHMADASLSNAEAVVEQKQAELEQAELDLERTEIRAPIDGIVIKRDVNPGQTVAVSLESKTLFKIANDLRQMEVHGKIDEADIGRLSAGQDVSFTVDAYPGRVFGGHVLQVRKSPEVVQNVVTYTALIAAPNPDLALLPGMTASVRIVVSELKDVLKIPNQALRFRPKGQAAPPGPGVPGKVGETDKAAAWVVGEDGAPKYVAIQIGTTDNYGAQLLSGPLREGSRVIVGVSSSVAAAPTGLRLGF
jgi:HlyD family secretion protein